MIRIAKKNKTKRNEKNKEEKQKKAADNSRGGSRIQDNTEPGA